MNIEIKSPEIEALILQRMRSGAFHNPEDLLRSVLQQPIEPETRTGAVLVEALQACPHPEVELDPARVASPLVRDVEL